MSDDGHLAQTTPDSATSLRNQLHRAEIARETLPPILAHLLTNEGGSLLNDEIVARVRGMVRHIVDQITSLGSQANNAEVPASRTSTQKFTRALYGRVPLLRHCHAIAVEGQLTERLERSAEIDPVLTPLLQSMMASKDDATSALAMSTLTAQALFMQHHMRMELPFTELPEDLFNDLLAQWLETADASNAGLFDRVYRQLRDQFVQTTSRLTLLSRLVGSMGSASSTALAISHSGVAIFLTSLAQSAGQDRATATVGMDVQQTAWLAAALRAGGMPVAGITEQITLIHSGQPVPDWLTDIGTQRARDLLGTFGA